MVVDLWFLTLAPFLFGSACEAGMFGSVSSSSNVACGTGTYKVSSVSLYFVSRPLKFAGSYLIILISSRLFLGSQQQQTVSSSKNDDDSAFRPRSLL